MLKKKDDIVWN